MNRDSKWVKALIWIILGSTVLSVFLGLIYSVI